MGFGIPEKSHLKATSVLSTYKTSALSGLTSHVIRLKKLDKADPCKSVRSGGALSSGRPPDGIAEQPFILRRGHHPSQSAVDEFTNEKIEKEIGFRRMGGKSA